MQKRNNAAYVVNTNTNIIFKYVENELYISKKDLRAENDGKFVKRKSNRSRKYTYARVKGDHSIDFKKQFPLSRVRKYINDGYFIECNNYHQARYHQAKLRFEKTTEENTKAEWKEVMERILEESPELLI